MRLVWTDPAVADREAIYKYVEAENPRAALALDDRFMRAAERLLSHPHLGRPGRLAGTREFVVNPRYILVYSIEADLLLILAVLHTARQWPPIE